MTKEKDMFNPLSNYVIVKPMAEEEIAKIEMQSKVIIIPHGVEKRGKTLFADVVAVGPGKWIKTGYSIAPATPTDEFSPMQVKIGDRVIMSEYDGNEVVVNGVTYMAIRDEFIFCIFDDGSLKKK